MTQSFALDRQQGKIMGVCAGASETTGVDVTLLYTREKHNAGLLRRAIEVEALPESWKSYFQHRLEKLTN